MKITFLPQGIGHHFEPGKSVLELASESGIPIDGNCAGAGTCGKCKIKLIEGSVPELDDKEMDRLTEYEVANGFRLACRLKPESDLVVEVPLVEETAKRKTKIMNLPRGFSFEQAYMQLAIVLPPATLEHQESDMERLQTACNLSNLYAADARVLNQLSSCIQAKKSIRVTLRGEELIDIESGSLEGSCYGIAFDIGTTTVVAHLWNLITGELVGINAVANPQGFYGADVISRISFAGEDQKNLELLQKRIVDSLNGMASSFIREYGIDRSQLMEFVVAGNTTMSHLLLGVDPSRLALSPFVPVFVRGVMGSAAELGLDGHRRAIYHLMPNIAGHVGSDIVAGILASGIMGKETEGIHLMLDIGTNGEIVLAGKGRALACSTAAGPAFEGASIYQGMRAAEGAIEKVHIADDVDIHVIGDCFPKGICGSGIIDAVAELLRLGLVDKSGKFVKPERLKESNMPESIVQRFRKGSNGMEFVLAYNDQYEDIVILQKDVREVQLAKAAIHAGIVIMMKEMGITFDDLGQVHIAGAFGNYISIESAVIIGLLPDIDRSKIVSEGNAAGIGACMTLLSKEVRKKGEQIARSIQHMELSASEDFTDEYIRAMKFGTE